jgi:YD repeat-containing protein
LVASTLPVVAQERTPPPAQGQERTPPAQAQPQAEALAQGELVNVDTKASTLAIKAADGAQMQFRYTAQTKVTGADDSIAGLATMSGARVTVHFTQQGADKVATQIAVQKKS